MFSRKNGNSVWMALIVALTMLVAACGNSTNTTQKAHPPTPATPVAQEMLATTAMTHTMNHDQTPMGATTSGSNSAAYMTIMNGSSTPDAILSASTDAAETVELHTVINDGGVMKMRPVDTIEIPAEGSQHLKPGGLHIMLLNIHHDLKQGEFVTLTLTLKNSGIIMIKAPVSIDDPQNLDNRISAGPITIENPWVRSAVARSMSNKHETTPDPGIHLSALTPIAPGQKPRVVATTNIVGDVVQQIGGNVLDLTVLIPLGTDPHAFEPSPQDLAAVSNADVVFVNGAGLETFLQPMLESAGASQGKIVAVSEGIDLITMEHTESDHHTNVPTMTHAMETTHQEGDHHDHGSIDPHVWFDPTNIEIWVKNIAAALQQADPANATIYAANASAYVKELQQLDTWIAQQVSQVPQANRKLVTDHVEFGYFARRYGFEQIGTVIPGYSTMAEPSAQDFAALEDVLRQHPVPAIFVGATVNPDLSQRIAQDTGKKLVTLYTGSLGEKGSLADTYLSFMRYNVIAMTNALK